MNPCDLKRRNENLSSPGDSCSTPAAGEAQTKKEYGARKERQMGVERTSIEHLAWHLKSTRFGQDLCRDLDQDLEDLIYSRPKLGFNLIVTKVNVS